MRRKVVSLATTGFSREFLVGGWRVGPALNQLEHDGVVRRIEGRAMAVLVELVQSPGQLCSKRRLIEAVWGDAFVSDEVLTHAISELRKALGDEPRNPRFIQTVPRKGYRLIAPVEWLPDTDTDGIEPNFPYRILEQIGSGGMGLVYRAEDSRLHRVVALKFLPPNLVADAKARARLWREARAAAALEHRNIATVFDVGVDPQDQMYLTMAYYSGQTLRQRIVDGPLTIAAACRYGRQIAEGLAAAHDKGILHRDIKPENVLVTDDDEVKIVDFGLAKSVSDPGLTLTDPGVTPGTVLYMSPESLGGDEADPRSDLWSLGVVLYEMLVGSPPFSGDSIPLATRSILEDRIVRPRAVRPEIPANLEGIVLDLLRRDPQLRPANAGRIVGRLVSASGTPQHTPPLWARPFNRWWDIVAGTTSRAWRRHSQSLVWAVLGALAASTLWLPWLARERAPQTPGRVLAFDLRLPPEVRFAEGADSSAAISRDGEWVVFIGEDETGQREPWALSLDGRSVVRLPGSRRPGQPFWSADGQSVGYFDANRLYVQALSGGPPVEMARVSSEFRGGSWGSNGVILFSPGSRQGVTLVRVEDGRSEQLTSPDRSRGEIGHLWPQLLPGDKHFLYFVSSNDPEVRGVYLASLSAPTGRRILATSASAIYAKGHLLYLNGSSLMARPFELERGAFSGPAALVTEDVASVFTYQGVFSASETGILVYSKDDRTVPTELRRVDLTGRTLEVLTEPGAYRNPSLSRDGRYVVIESHRGTDIDLVMIELETGRQRRIRDEDAHQPMFPALSADGEQLIYVVETGDGVDLRRLQLNGTAPPETLLASPLPVHPSDGSPDGRYLLLGKRTRRGDFDTLLFDVESRQTSPFLDQPPHEGSSEFSPSGRRLAYITEEPGRFEVYVEPFPRSGRRCQASDEGGFDPHWQTESTILYLSPNGTLFRVEIEDLERCALSEPIPLFDARVEPPPHSRNHFEIIGPNQQLLINSIVETHTTSQIGVLVDWSALIR